MKKNWLDKRIKDIESWGILTLMSELKKSLDERYSREEAVLVYNPGLNIKYKGSPLECLRREKHEIDKVYKTYFEKFYKELEEKK